MLNNVKLYAHPNPNKRVLNNNSENEYYVIPKNYLDKLTSFDDHIYEDWAFDLNDKRKIKRIKKQNK